MDGDGRVEERYKPQAEITIANSLANTSGHLGRTQTNIPITIADELHRRFGGYDGAPRFMAVSPGFIPSSDLSRHAGIFGNFFLKSVLDGVLKWIGLVKFTRTIEEGAHCYYLAATEDEVESGKYYSLTTTEDGVQGSELKWEASSKESYDEKTAAALWTTTEETIAAILGAGAVPSNEARNKGKIAQCNL